MVNSEKSFLEAVSESPFLPNDLELKDRVKRYLQGEREPIIELGWPSMVGNYGLLWHQITAIGGYANYGKGTFARQLMLQSSIKYGFNCGIWCPEDMPIYHPYMDFIRTYSGLNTEDINAHDFIGTQRGLENYDFIRSRMYVIDSVEWTNDSMDDVLGAFKRMHDENGCKMFLLDPYKDIEKDHNLRDDVLVHEDVKKVKAFVRDNEVHVFLALHMKTPKTKNGEDLPPPDYHQLHFGDSWSKDLDNIIMYHHPTYNSDRKNNNRIISIAKCKKRRLQGNEDQFNMEWNYWQNRILDENGKCGLPNRVPNVDITIHSSGIPQGAIDRAHENNLLLPTEELPF